MGLFSFARRKNRKIDSEQPEKREECCARAQERCCSDTEDERCADNQDCCPDTEQCCSSGQEEGPAGQSDESGGEVRAEGKLELKILGSGCANCNRLEEAAKQALADLSLDADLVHVTDFAQIAAYGVMSTPALMVNEKLVSYGKVLSKDQVKKILTEMGLA